MARPGKYSYWRDRFGLEEVRRLAEEGLSDEEIAERAGVEYAIFKVWKRKYQKLYDAIELGRREADLSVVEALYKKATGYSVKTSKTHKLKRIDYDPDTGKKIKEYEELAVGIDEDYVMPDLKAEIFWLKNRQPAKWTDRELGRAEDEVTESGVVEIPSADKIGEYQDDGGE